MTATAPDRISAALAGRYRIERELGAGGMATVYLAHDEKHDRKVAIKVLKPELAAVLGAERFIVEIKTTASLSHPHILPLFDSGSADGFLYYVMPYIEGETIRDRLNRETQFSVDDSVRISREIADALDYAHRRGVIHRDIKPENILLHDGRAMVMDFGIALAVSAAAGGRMTETGLSLGTPHYMSPEQATAEKDISGRSDVYSLATVLYEMLAGQPPHVGGAAQQIIMKIITEPAPPVTKYRKSVPPNVSAALSQALEKLPADRFQSARAFGDALVNPTYATSNYAITDAARGRSNVITLPVLVSSAIAVVALGFALAVWRRAEPIRPVSRFSIQLPDSQEIGTGNFVRIAVAPDGRSFIYVAQRGGIGTTQLMLRSLEQLKATPIPGTEGAGNPSFSPDGKSVAFTASGAPRSLKVVSLAGGSPITLTNKLVDLGGVSWGEDGYIYYDGHLPGDGLARIRATGGGEPEAVSVPDSAKGELYHNMPVVLPGARGVLIAVAHPGGSTTSEIAVVDPSTRKHRILARGLGAHYVASGHLVWVAPGGTMMAAPFDLKTLRLTGDAVPIGTGVAITGLQRVDFGVGANGTAAWIQGPSTGAQQQLMWETRDGQRTPVDDQWVTDMIGNPALSPDGKKVAVSVGASPSDSHVYIKQLDHGPATKLADDGYAPHWSNDASEVYFLGRNQRVLKAPADGRALATQVFKARGMVPTGFDVSPDGSTFFLVGNGSLYRGKAGTDSLEKLDVAPGPVTAPTISPDGKWLAYSSDETGRLEVYVRPLPDVMRAKFQISSGGGRTARWSRDARQLFFLDEQMVLNAVAIGGGPSLSAGIPKPLFSTAQYLVAGNRSFDVDRTGSRFIFFGAPKAGPIEREQLILVENFFSELLAKVPVRR
jgi:serine/threonine-protein kinase